MLHYMVLLSKLQLQNGYISPIFFAFFSFFRNRLFSVKLTRALLLFL